MISEYDLKRLERGRVIATITVISRHERHDADERLMRLRHEYDDIVSGNMHLHLRKGYCLEIFIAEGELNRIMEFIGRIRALRGIQQVKYTLVPA
ncbi:MAG: hypothetical protein DRN15_08940 [Thermoprotei archaeon]|nr:MAG: hypothetical protein DRN15_08940 [Thermoprotei archaeon]RLF22898.1 MAG: hypothetical protein DRM97_05290 [Thermoprotei archaeon]